MKTVRSVRIAGAVILAAAGLAACATPGYVRKSVNAEDQKVGTRMSAQDTRMDHLDKNTRDAMERAEAAHKLAEGKFLYEMVLSDDSVKFPTNGSELSQEAKTRLMDFIQKLKTDNKNVYIEIQGNTDSIGSDKANLILGQERAETVLRYLNMQHGFPLSRMNAVSYGKFKPIADNKTAEGRAKNRRVTLVVLY